jgi:predicted Zn-dependent protease
LSLVAAWYLGDVSNAAAAVAGGMGTLSYSREAEHRADLYAVDTMKANHLSTKNAAALFRRLQAWEPPATEAGKSADPKTAGRPDRKPGGLRFAVPEYLSTHPDTDSRIALFEADGATDPAP